MALPLAPIAWTTLRAGAVLAVAVLAARKHRKSPEHVWRNAALNDVPDGVELGSDFSKSGATGHASTRFHRTIRFGRKGPGFELDIGALGRIRLRRV